MSIQRCSTCVTASSEATFATWCQVCYSNAQQRSGAWALNRWSRQMVQIKNSSEMTMTTQVFPACAWNSLTLNPRLRKRSSCHGRKAETQ
jgi:hypothetical protein